MKSEQKRSLDLESHTSDSESTIDPVSTNFSTHLNYYENFFQMETDVNIFSKNQTAFKKYNIAYNKNNHQKELNIVILNQSANSQIFRLAVSFSYFMFDITVLCLIEDSRSFDGLKLIGEGSFSKVFICDLGIDEVFAIKSIKYRNVTSLERTKETEKNLRNSIFEYCLYKLFSCLEIGPCLKNNLGFDMIIYNDSIEFAMEACEKIKYEERLPFESLKLMHSFKIIHGDIKNENILWSPTFEKNVFVDFGLSQFLNENIGENTFTKYFGTYNFCCEEMKELFHKETFGYVDLYYNDVKGLEIIEKRQQFFVLLNKNEMERNVNMSKSYFNVYKNFIRNVQLIQLIYSKNTKEVKLFVENHRSIEINELFISVFGEFQKSFNFHKIEKFILSKFQDIEELQKKSSKKDHSKLEKRIQNAASHFDGTIHDVMILFLRCFNEDITPSALKRKLELENFILNLSASDLQLWESLVELSINPYTKIEDFRKSFEIIKSKLSIEEWNPIRNPEFEIYLKAKQISIQVFSKYGINLFDIYNKFVYNKFSETLPINFTQILENESTKAQKTEKLKHLSIDQLENLFKAEQDSTEKESSQILKNYVKEVLKDYGLSEVPVPLELLEKTYELILSKENGQFSTKAIEYFEIFQNFEPAWNSMLISTFRDDLLKRHKNFFNHPSFFNYFKKIFKSINTYFDYFKEHYKSVNIFCFSIYHSTQVFFQEIFHHQIFEEEKIISFITFEFKEIIVFLDTFHAKKFILFEILEEIIKVCSINFEEDQLSPEKTKVYAFILTECINLIFQTDEIEYENLFYISEVFIFLPESFKPITFPYAQLILEEVNKMIIENKNTQILAENLLLKKKLLNYLNEMTNETEKELLGQIMKHMDKNLLKYIDTTRMNCIEIYSEYIINSANEQSAENEIKNIMVIFMESEKLFVPFYSLPYFVESLAFYFAKKPHEHFEFYFEIMLQFLSRSSLKLEKEENFSAFICINLVINKKIYFETLEPKYQNLKQIAKFDPKVAQKMYSELMDRCIKEISLSNEFYYKYPNSIIIIKSLFQVHLANPVYPLPKEKVFHYFKMCSYFINYSSIYFQREFIIFMNVATILFIEKDLIETNLRKKRLYEARSLRACSKPIKSQMSLFSKISTKKVEKIILSFNTKIKNLYENKMDEVFIDPISNINIGQMGYINICYHSIIPHWNMSL